MFGRKARDERRICPHGCGRVVLQSRSANHYLIEHMQKPLQAVRVVDLLKERLDARVTM